MLEFALATENEIRAELASRLRKRRLAQGLSLETLAKRAGIGRNTLQRIEVTGDCTFENFIRTVVALGLAQELQGLFVLNAFSIAQLEKQTELAKRIRAPRQPSLKK